MIDDLPIPVLESLFDSICAMISNNILHSKEHRKTLENEVTSSSFEEKNQIVTVDNKSTEIVSDIRIVASSIAESVMKR